MPDAPETLKAIVARLEAVRNARIVRRLPGGAASQSWLLEANGRNLVLRVDEPAAEGLKPDRRREAEILQIVGNAGLGPELIWSDPDLGIQLHGYLPGVTWSETDIRRKDCLARLARSMAGLHALPVTVPRLDPSSAVDRYDRLVATSDSAEMANEARELIGQLEDDPARHALCHNDLNRHNIIGDENVRFLDWEYAGMGDPLFDLATVIRHHDLPVDIGQWLVDGYRQAAGPVDVERLGLQCRLYDLIAALWYLAMGARFGSDAGLSAQRERALVRLRKAPPVFANRSRS